MVTFIACCTFFILIGVNIYGYIAYQNKISELIIDCDEVKLRNVILFSNEDIAKAIRKRLDKGEKFVKIYYFNKHYIKINDTEGKECIKRRIEDIQDFLIEKSDLNLDNSLINNKIDERIMEVWIDYGYNQRYRRIFRTELEDMIETEKISNSTYNQIYRRFYKFEK